MLETWREEDPSSQLASASGETITPDEAAETLVRGIAAGRFLILTHAETQTYAQRRAGDPERWLGGMQRFQAQIDAARVWESSKRLAASAPGAYRGERSLTSMREPTRLLGGGSFFEGPRWHEGLWWVSDFYTGGGRILAVDPEGAIEREIPLEQPSGLGWLPDGDLLAVSMTGHKLWRVPAIRRARGLRRPLRALARRGQRHVRRRRGPRLGRQLRLRPLRRRAGDAARR